ncbi:MAG: hypothetical protein MUF54_19380 [Polyangiaceae bacterium]|jgi:hypothetical protein|nr:hypothetical protein [Polyangiaceae bacterium]
MKRNARALGLVSMLALIGCAGAPDGDSSFDSTQEPLVGRPLTIGIVGASGGDIESCEELHSFVVNFTSTVGPAQALPEDQRRAFAEARWLQTQSTTSAQYHAIPNCNTRFRERGRAQAQKIAHELSGMLFGVKTKAYAGFRYLYGEGIPQGLTLIDALEQARQDGVTHLFVTDQDDILFSVIMQQIGFKQIEDYLSQHPDWHVNVVGINGYASQPHFDDLLATNVVHNVKKWLGWVPANDVVVVLPCQGISQAQEQTDPHARQARELANRVQALLPAYEIRLAFQHWGTDPATPPNPPRSVSQPADYTVLPEVARGTRNHVLISPNLQWPVTDISVLWRQEVRYLETIKEIDATKVVENYEAWDSSRAFARYSARIMRDTLLFGASSTYDLTLIRKDGFQTTR